MKRCVSEGDSTYEDDRRIANARFNYKPGRICFCENAGDINNVFRVEAPKYHLKKFRVRSGGHHHEGMSSGPSDVMVIDVSNINHIEIDDRADVLRVGPGAKLSDIYAAILAKK